MTVLPGENRLDLTTDQGSPHQEIRGRVVGPDGGAVAGAVVLAGSSARTFSAGDGSFRLIVADNQDHDVWAEKEGFSAAKAGAAVHVAGAPVEGVEIRLDHGGILTGRLLGLDREELARASVEVELIPPFLAYVRFFAPGGVGGTTYSRSDGSFHVRLEDGTYRVVARREGYLWTLQEDAVAVDGAPVSGLELRLDRAAAIRGRILVDQLA